MQKTVTVAVDRLVQHKLYKKIQRRTSKFLAHDENGICKVGDRVRIIETRPECAKEMACGEGDYKRHDCGLMITFLTDGGVVVS